MVIFSPCNQRPFQFQEPFYWRYLPFIRLFFRPKFQGISPQNMAQNMLLTYLHFRIHWLKVGFPTSPEALGHVPDFAGDAGRCYMAMVGKPKHAIGQSKGNTGNMWEQYWKNRETWKHMGKTWEYMGKSPINGGLNGKKHWTKWMIFRDYNHTCLPEGIHVMRLQWAPPCRI